MVKAPVHEWGRRLSDALRAALDSGDLASAKRLALEGDGQAQSLATEYAYLSRGLGITARVLLRLLRETAERRDGRAARSDLVALVHRLSTDLAEIVERRLGGPPRSPASGVPGTVDEAAAVSMRALEEAQALLERGQARLAGEILRSIDAGDRGQALALVEQKQLGQYAPLRDRLVLFMAESFGWILRHHGPRELLRFHLDAAEAQRAGFEKWQAMSPQELAWTTAFLLKQHLGRVAVREDEEGFTIEQAPCGSGGRLQLMGAYAGPAALPFVESPGPLTFGQPILPVYCSHCAIWNALAPLRWFGRPLWVLDRPARPDGGCTVRIPRRRDGAPQEYVARLTTRGED